MKIIKRFKVYKETRLQAYFTRVSSWSVSVFLSTYKQTVVMRKAGILSQSVVCVSNPPSKDEVRR